MDEASNKETYVNPYWGGVLLGVVLFLAFNKDLAFLARKEAILGFGIGCLIAFSRFLYGLNIRQITFCSQTFLAAGIAKDLAGMVG